MGHQQLLVQLQRKHPKINVFKRGHKDIRYTYPLKHTKKTLLETERYDASSHNSSTLHTYINMLFWYIYWLTSRSKQELYHLNDTISKFLHVYLFITVLVADAAMILCDSSIFQLHLRSKICQCSLVSPKTEPKTSSMKHPRKNVSPPKHSKECNYRRSCLRGALPNKSPTYSLCAYSQGVIRKKP